MEFAYTATTDSGISSTETASVTFLIGNVFTNVHLAGKKNGGVAFGKYSASTDDTPMFECNYPAYFYGGIAQIGDGSGNLLELLMQTLPDNYFDALITDPPYANGSNLIAKAAATSVKYTSRKNGNPLPDFDGDSMDQRTWTLFMTDILREATAIAPNSLYCLRLPLLRIIRMPSAMTVAR